MILRGDFARPPVKEDYIYCCGHRLSVCEVVWRSWYIQLTNGIHLHIFNPFQASSSTTSPRPLANGAKTSPSIILLGHWPPSWEVVNDTHLPIRPRHLQISHRFLHLFDYLPTTRKRPVSYSNWLTARVGSRISLQVRPVFEELREW